MEAAQSQPMKPRFLFSVLAVGSLMLVVIVALRIRQQPAAARSAVTGLPATPDLSRWPQEMQDRVSAATRALAGSGESSRAALRELAMLYYANGYNSEAARALRTLMQADPANSRWPHLLGLLEERAGHAPEAEALFASAAHLAPDYAPEIIHRANLLGGMGQWASARQLFEQCLAFTPQDPRAPFGLAKLDFARGDEPAAITRLKKAVSQHPEYQEIHLMLADLLAKAGDTQHADEQRAFLANGQGSPPDSDPYLDEVFLFCYDRERLHVLGELRNQAGNSKAALPYIRRAAQLDPMDMDTQEALARTLMKLQRWQEAEDTLKQALKRIGSDAVLDARLTELLLARNRANEAIALLLQERAKQPESALIENALGLAYLSLERTTEAVDAFAAAARLDPLFPDAQLNLARSYLKAGNPTLARSWAERALKLRPETFEGLALRTAAALQMNDLDAALTSARELSRRGGISAEYRPIYTAALLRAGNVAAERGEHTRAEQLYQDGLAANENDGQLHGALGMLYGKLRRYPEARKEFEIFLRLEPRNPVGYLLLGAAFNSANEPNKARLTWQSGLNVATEIGDTTHAAQLRRLLGE